MKEIRLTQLSVGKYNWANESEESCQFSMGIYDENGVVKRGGVECKLRVSHSEDPETMERELRSAWERGEIDYLIECSAKDSSRWFGSTDYAAQTLAFAAEYRDSKDELESSYVSEHKKNIERQIESLERQLKTLGFSTEGDDAVEVARKNVLESAGGPRAMAEWKKKSMADLKEDSEAYKKAAQSLEGYNKRAEMLESLIK